MLEGIVFDFDGLMLDTEYPQYLAWRSLYEMHGHDLPIERWIDVLGRPAWMFDFFAHLEEQVGQKLDRERFDRERRAKVLRLIDESELLPGVRKLVERAQARGLRLSIASGSDRPWVSGYLQKHGLAEAFPILVTREETETHKPEPGPFAEACRRMETLPAATLALEDSPNGILSASRAGLFAVAVPNRVTTGQAFEGADRVIQSLEELDLDVIAGLMASKQAV
ncbi:HAD family hydrolase [Mucisphaera sp.]|uniref:HAD family hydrolase n=1 Tax=Mucisphaera sp. TaxID=2913024 RepID=UPI003D10461D